MLLFQEYPFWQSAPKQEVVREEVAMRLRTPWEFVPQQQIHISFASL